MLFSTDSGSLLKNENKNWSRRMKRNNKCYMPKAEWMEEEMLLVFLNSIRFVFGGENWTIWKNHLIFSTFFDFVLFVCRWLPLKLFTHAIVLELRWIRNVLKFKCEQHHNSAPQIIQKNFGWQLVFRLAIASCGASNWLAIRCTNFNSFYAMSMCNGCHANDHKITWRERPSQTIWSGFPEIRFAHFELPFCSTTYKSNRFRI